MQEARTAFRESGLLWNRNLSTTKDGYIVAILPDCGLSLSNP